MKGRAEPRKKGGARMRQLGYRQVTVWLDGKELAAIRERHAAEPLASLLRRLACDDAGVRFHIR